MGHTRWVLCSLATKMHTIAREKATIYAGWTIVKAFPCEANVLFGCFSEPTAATRAWAIFAHPQPSCSSAAGRGGGEVLIRNG